MGGGCKRPYHRNKKRVIAAKKIRTDSFSSAEAKRLRPGSASSKTSTPTVRVAIEVQEQMGMAKVNEFAAVFVAAIALLAQVNGRIYQTKDAIVFEIDRAWDGSFLSKNLPFSQSDFMPIKTFLNGGLAPNSQIPFVEPIPQVNSYSIDGLHPQQQGPNIYSWLHQHPFVYGGAYAVPSIDSRTGPTLKQEAKQNNVACGKGPNQNRIVNGAEAIENSWPFMLSLMVVKLGMHDRGNGKDIPDDAQMTRRISRMNIHKAYNARRMYFDIAIVTMDSPVAFSAAISPVCLAPASGRLDLYAGETASVMGWGDEYYGADAGSQKLLEANAPIITNAECKQIYSDPGTIVNHMLCADNTDADSCQGDSGGPLVVQSMEDGRWYQAGIVSFGKGCADPDFPAAVYTRVNWLRGWINGNMKDY
ncbi:hypothetical protein GHT06_020044 [Daphnia sinensis]|uniref:Peptidase S1 domain-containing protein n=1 Tax=Daphnia sinensis TaxID=1820382 RepID=A0AAD5KM26_9CRUS|nr:hypothetical protein GHT06_020044 [Daphnia sinensis]